MNELLSGEIIEQGLQVVTFDKRPALGLVSQPVHDVLHVHRLRCRDVALQQLQPGFAGKLLARPDEVIESERGSLELGNGVNHDFGWVGVFTCPMPPQFGDVFSHASPLTSDMRRWQWCPGRTCAGVERGSSRPHRARSDHTLSNSTALTVCYVVGARKASTRLRSSSWMISTRGRASITLNRYSRDIAEYSLS